MSSRQITVLGECVADAFTEPAKAGNELALRVPPGGGPANTAVALARFLARLSGDVFGRLFRAHPEAFGVDLSYAVAAGEPARRRWSESPAGRWWRSFLAAAPRATVSIDPNVRPLLVRPEDHRARPAHWCALADILRLSEDDLELLLPGTPPEQACDIRYAAGVRLVVITLGGDGALASPDGERLRVPAVATRVVDTVGAGDSFTAGLLHHLVSRGLLGGRPAGRIVSVSAMSRKAAGSACSVAGPNPPWRNQLTQLATADGA